MQNSNVNVIAKSELKQSSTLNTFGVWSVVDFPRFQLGHDLVFSIVC